VKRPIEIKSSAIQQMHRETHAVHKLHSYFHLRVALGIILAFGTPYPAASREHENASNEANNQTNSMCLIIMDDNRPEILNEDI
jgi:hypothetical protein